ncbi:hypothetical protein CKO38_00570 [Rhodospirillum rubrum]|uniref:hypothetical protein n=1 Tax=Rhodospirillum rubrum TaxID=1085 RepID=UPI001902CFBB|nr:hypothetical protein [Rhodospirillum rubrum]MBK1663170.1 hypothetical protein [Rhodospirillum rubrum]MBK1675187.1 hypothetical protein [Rhodospirillum rubrum]
MQGRAREQGESFPGFLARLAAGFGPQALCVRHELYFLAVTPTGFRPGWMQALRALGALGRDAALLWLRIAPPPPPPTAAVFLVATLPGANGWHILKRGLSALPAKAGACAVLHPRLWPRLGPSLGLWWGRPPRWDGVDATSLPYPPLSALWQAARLALPALSCRDAKLNRFAVAATLARHGLWRAAWRRLARDRRGALVLHNDFDMMSAACLGLGLPTVCLQHGVPTDEFFPARADVQVVWGRSSRAAYVEGGVERGHLVVDALGRGEGGTVPSGPPAGFALISQGHTPLYGPELGAKLLDLARDLAALLPDGLDLLLHPAEDPQSTAYAGVKGLRLSLPPHGLLRQRNAGRSWLVAGFSSTALIDAAVAGHYVVGLDWVLPGSPLAQGVTLAPRRFATASDLAAFHEALTQEDPLRTSLAADLIDWRRATFSSETGGLRAHLARVLAR